MAKATHKMKHLIEDLAKISESPFLSWWEAWQFALWHCADAVAESYVLLQRQQAEGLKPQNPPHTGIPSPTSTHLLQ